MWAERGTDLVVGTAEPVGVARGEALAAWHARHQLVEGHAHVHGANLGVGRDRWRAVGGFGAAGRGRGRRPGRAGARRHRPLGRHRHHRVLTSGRSRSRVEHGFADYLDDLEAETGERCRRR